MKHDFQLTRKNIYKSFHGQESFINTIYYGTKSEKNQEEWINLWVRFDIS